MNPVKCTECGGYRSLVELMRRMTGTPDASCCWLFWRYLPEYVTWHERMRPEVEFFGDFGLGSDYR